MAVEELVDVHVVDAGKRAGREDRQDVRVRPGAWPGLALPALGEGGGGTLAAVAAGAAGLGAEGGLAAPEPAGMVERDTQGDGVRRVD